MNQKSSAYFSILAILISTPPGPPETFPPLSPPSPLLHPPLPPPPPPPPQPPPPPPKKPPNKPPKKLLSPDQHSEAKFVSFSVTPKQSKVLTTIAAPAAANAIGTNPPPPKTAPPIALNPQEIPASTPKPIPQQIASLVIPS